MLVIELWGVCVRECVIMCYILKQLIFLGKILQFLSLLFRKFFLLGNVVLKKYVFKTLVQFIYWEINILRVWGY